ncbi:hypothetical protein E2I00_013950, partial [Balaenoptera physalus]
GYLIKVGNLSRGAVQLTGELPNADAGYHEAFLETLHATISLFQEPQFDEIAGGFDQLPQALHAALLPRTVPLHSPAEEVESYGDHVHITYRTPDPLQTRVHLTADYLIEDALRSVHYSSATKVILTRRQHFWEHKGAVQHQPAFRFIFYANHIFPNGTGVILASYTLDDDSSFFAVMDEEVRALGPYSMVKHWSQDPYSMGGFASFTPYQYVDYAQELCQPEGQAHFADEHTTLAPGWIDTAIKSQLRAAQNIQEAENRLSGHGRQPRSSCRTPGTPECPTSLSRAKPEIEPNLQKQGQSR